MRKESVYLDTTIPSAYFDKREPEKMRLAREIWKILNKKYRIFISAIAIEEISATPDDNLKAKLLNLVKDSNKLPISEEVRLLARGYIEQGIIPAKHTEDALHTAVASVNKVDFFLTWNCTHLASAHKRRQIRLYNGTCGVYCPEIVIPEELIAEEVKESSKRYREPAFLQDIHRRQVDNYEQTRKMNNRQRIDFLVKKAEETVRK